MLYFSQGEDRVEKVDLHSIYLTLGVGLSSTLTYPEFTQSKLENIVIRYAMRMCQGITLVASRWKDVEFELIQLSPAPRKKQKKVR